MYPPIAVTTHSQALADFLYVLDMGYNFDVAQHYLTQERVMDDAVLRGFETIWEGIDRKLPGLETMFSRHQRLGFLPTFLRSETWRLGTPEALTEFLEQCDPSQFALQLLSYFDNQERESGFYEGLISDQRRLFMFIQSLKISENIKWELANFLGPANPIMAIFCETLETLAKRYRAYIASQEEELQRFCAKLEDKLRGLDEKPQRFFLFEEEPFLKDSFHLQDYESVTITPAFFNNDAIYRVFDEKTLHIYLGCQYERALERRSQQRGWQDLEQILKALADDTRLKVFRLLRQRMMYVGEIAAALNLAVSTTSYHLEMMSGAGLVRVKMIGKRAYYSINDARMEEVIGLMGRYFTGVAADGTE